MKGNNNDMSNYRPISILPSSQTFFKKYCKLDCWSIWPFIIF